MEERSAATIRAIVAADIVGSTALRASLGDQRADRLLRAFVELAADATGRFGGVIRRWMGDGMTASFPSASAAIGAALAIQRSVALYARRPEAVAPFEVRIGIGVGEVVFDPADDEEHGVAVVEAARLERLARPGEVVATELVRLLGERRSSACFEPLGPVTLKGFDDPIDVVRVIDPMPLDMLRPVPSSLVVDRRFPLVGRGSAVSSALDVWKEVAAGEPRTLLICGQPGIGKTRFAAQVADVAHTENALVLGGVCDADLAVPYQPIARALTGAREFHADLDAAIGGGEGPLGPLFPARRPGRDDGGAAERLELFEAVVGVVEALCANQPLVIVLDDVQWATPPTVQLIRHLVRRLDQSRVLIIATYRAEEVTPAHPLNDLLVEARGSTRCAALELGPLEIDDVVTLIDARLPGTEPAGFESFATRVVHESAGNPFFICELLDHLSSTGQLAALVAAGNESLPIPDSVRGVVGQRLSRLAPEVSDLLVTAAVVGHSFDVDLLADLLERRLDDVLDLVEQAAGVALVQEVRAGVFAFAHAMVRSTVLERLSATRRAISHRRVAEALDRLRPDSHDHLALHWHLAGADDRAAVHRELAARRDLEAFAFESAAERYQQLLDHYGRVETNEAARAWLGLGYARRALGQPDYLEAMVEAGRLARRVRDADVLADAAVGCVWPGTYLRPGEILGGLAVIELTEDALDVIGSSDPRRPRLLATIGVHDVDPNRRQAFLDEARELAEAIGDPAVLGHVLVAEHLADWNPASLDRRAAVIERLTRVARTAGVAEIEFYAGLFVVFNALERGDLPRARRALRELESSSRAAHGVYLEFMAERLAVSFDLFTGSPDAQARIDSLAARFADTHADTVNTWAAQTALLANYEGRMAALVPAIRSVLDKTNVGEVWRSSLGLALALDGQTEEAAEILAAWEEPAFDYFWLVSVVTAGDLAAELGDADASRALFARLEPYRDQLCIAGPGSLCYGFVATTLGRLALTMGDAEQAIELLTTAVERADRVGAPYDAVRARRVLAEAMLATGAETADVLDLIESASATAERHGYAGERHLLANLAISATA